MKNFYKDFVEETIEYEDIKSYIEEWKNSSTDMEVHDYLGLSPEDYKLYIEKEDEFIEFLVTKRNIWRRKKENNNIN